MEDADGEAKRFITNLLQYRKFDKVRSTYLDGILKVIGVDGYIHPNFWLHTAESFRSSSDHPNFQNIPVRTEIGRDVRKAFVPRNDFLLEFDFGGAEVRLIACLSEDAELIKQIKDDVDLHRRWAARLFDKSEEKIDKVERHKGKNEFVFRCFYGAGVPKICRMWNFLESEGRRFYNWFWEEYEDVRNWQLEQYDIYNKRGYVESPLGFRRYAPLNPSQIMNFPIQGTCFHLLFCTLNELDAALTKAKTRS